MAHSHPRDRGHPSIDDQFQSFLTDLSLHLSKDNLEQLCFLLRFPDATTESVTSGSKLFRVLQSQHRINPNDVSLLVKAFKDIQRIDLKNKVEAYRAEIATQCKSNQPTRTPVSKPGAGSTKKPNVALLTPAHLTHDITQQNKGKGTVHEEKQSPPTTAAERKTSSDISPMQAEATSSTTSEYALGQLAADQLPGPVTGLENPFSPKPLDKLTSLEQYQMSNDSAGLCIIISNYDFSKARKDPDLEDLEDRSGTEKDEEELRKTFTWLGYTVETAKDKSAADMCTYLKSVAARDHSQYDSLCCCLLTHGTESGLYGTDGKIVSYPDLFAMFNPGNCKTLAEKPKLFFIQACLGQEVLSGRKDNLIPFTGEMHFFLGFPTVFGCQSYRHVEMGSFYIESLCKALQGMAQTAPFETITLQVTNRVTTNFEVSCVRQIPIPVSSLIKQLHFKPASEKYEDTLVKEKESTE